MTKEPRYLPNVLAAILHTVPDGEEVKMALEQIQRSALYTAPEAMEGHWIAAQNALQALANRDEAWCIKCNAIWNNTEAKP